MARFANLMGTSIAKPMTWNEVTADLSIPDDHQEFGRGAIERLRSNFSEPTSENDLKNCQEYLQDEIACYEHAAQHHGKCNDMYHENVARSDIAELAVLRTVLGRLEVFSLQQATEKTPDRGGIPGQCVCCGYCCLPFSIALPQSSNRFGFRSTARRKVLVCSASIARSVGSRSR